MQTIFFGSFCLYIVNMSKFGALQAEAWYLSWTDAYIEFIAFSSRPSLSCRFITNVVKPGKICFMTQGKGLFYTTPSLVSWVLYKILLLKMANYEICFGSASKQSFFSKNVP